MNPHAHIPARITVSVRNDNSVSYHSASSSEDEVDDPPTHSLIVLGTRTKPAYPLSHAIAEEALFMPNDTSAFRTIYNCDGNNLFIHGTDVTTKEEIEFYVDKAVDRNITTFFMSCHCGQDMNTRGKSFVLAGDRFSETEFQALADPEIARPNTGERGIVACRQLIEQGHDPLGIALDHAKMKGKETFITFRLNEVHCVEDPDSYALSQFWLDHPEWHIGTPGERLPDLHREILGPVHPIVQTWLPGGLNFAIPEVRERTLSQIAEFCHRYGIERAPTIDGLDLDFQRFPIYFRFGEEAAGIAIMNDFVRKVRKITDAVSAQRNRPLLLSARIMAKPEQNRALGLDPFTWAQEGLLDFVTVSHYLRNQFTLPVREYRKLFPASLPLYASIEYAVDGDTYRQLARDLWREEPDGIMLFNFFAGNTPYEVIDELVDRERMLG